MCALWIEKGEKNPLHVWQALPAPAPSDSILHCIRPRSDSLIEFNC